jgi:hypothetical protein
MLSKPKDNFFFGLLAGLATLVLSYLSLRYVRLMAADHYGNPYIFPAPRVELITILINVLLFRIMIVNIKKEETGKGILFVTVILAITFFILFFKFNFRLP